MEHASGRFSPQPTHLTLAKREGDAKLHTANEHSLIDAENECKFLMKNSEIGSCA